MAPIPARPNHPYERVLQGDALDISPDCIKIITPDGMLQHLNLAGCAALGIDQSRVVGVQWLPLLPSQVHERGFQALGDAAQGFSSRFPGISDSPGAGLRHWDNLLLPLKDEAGKVLEILCVSRDVTQQEENDNRLRQMIAQRARRCTDILRELREELVLPSSNSVGMLKNVESVVMPQDKGEAADLVSKRKGRAKKIDLNYLTSKEVECLFWVKLGKTAWETAEIIGVSRRTVEFHLANSVKKLDASNKIHAAFIAFSMGII